MLKIAIISDIHHCPEKNKEVGVQLETFIKKAQELDADLIVDLGDRISNVSKEADANNLKVIADLFKETKLFWHHILGNHDVKNLSINETEKVLSSPLNMHNFLIKGYNLIFWNASAQMSFESGFTKLKEEEINWLAKTLKDSRAPCIMMTTT
jgi:predicted MPP superfamily phosphohydrolase